LKEAQLTGTGSPGVLRTPGVLGCHASHVFRRCRSSTGITFGSVAHNFVE
jgi:hypothetical protein